MDISQYKAALPQLEKADPARKSFHLEIVEEITYRSHQQRGEDYSTVYDVRNYIKFHAQTDVKRLAAAVEQSIAAHPIYSSELAEEDGRVVVRKANRPLNLEVKTATEEEAVAYIPLFHDTPRTKEEALYKIVIMQTPECVYMFVRLNHAITDGASQVRLCMEICSRYNGEPVEPETYNWFDWSAYKEAVGKSEAAGHLLDDFGQLLSTYPDSATSYQPKTPEEYRGLLLSRQEMKALHACGVKLKANKAMLLMAAYCLALMRLRGLDKIAVTTTFHNRQLPHTGAIHGCMALQLPLLAELPASGLVSDYIARFVELHEYILQNISMLNEGVRSRFANKMDFSSSLNIVVRPKDPILDGVPATICMYGATLAPIRLLPRVFTTPNGWILQLQSNELDVEGMKSLHESLRSILLNMPKAETVSQL